MIWEFAGNADRATVSFNPGTGHPLGQRGHGGSHRPCYLLSYNFVLSRCSTHSSAIHSYYRRKPRDLPCAGRPIRSFLTVRKFFCQNPGCAQNVFDSAIPRLHRGLLSPHVALAQRCAGDWLCHLWKGWRATLCEARGFSRKVSGSCMTSGLLCGFFRTA